MHVLLHDVGRLKMATTVTLKTSEKPSKPWRVIIRCLSGVAPPNGLTMDKDVDTFDEAVAEARKDMTVLNEICREDQVDRRLYFKLSIIEV
jgi:hypothetical protein